MPFGRVFARWSSQRRSPRSQRAGQIADEPKEGRSRARQRAREVPRGPPCRWWSPGQRRSRQKENPTRFSSAEEPIFLNYRSVTRGVPFHFFLPSFRAYPARSIAVRTIPGTHLGHEGHFWPPPCRGAGNVRAGTEPGARFGRADSPGAPTGWAIPPDPQQPRGGEIPVQGGP